MMRRRMLGRTGIEVSEIGLGTAQLANADGGSPGIRRISFEDARLVLEEAVGIGISFFDTGDQYGAAEHLLGTLPPGLRDRVIVATKAGLRDDGVRDFSDAYLASRLMRSLKRLNTDYLDIFQLNKPSIDQLRSGEVFDFLERQKRRGLIRWAGVVIGSIDTGFASLEAGVVDCLQVFYNVIYQEAEPLITEAFRRGVGVIVRSPLNSGLLCGISGVGAPKRVFPIEDERSRYFCGLQYERRIAAIQAIAEDLQLDPIDGLLELALRYILSNRSVSTTIPGTSKIEQLRDFARCSCMPLLTDDELARVRTVVSHRMAGVDGPVQLQ